MEPVAYSRKPLKWSRMPIIFDIEDHPNCTTVVGCLPFLVSPTIHNLKVTEMLVDSGAGLNLISPKVISKLQILDEELKVTSTFQGINPGRSHPKGKIPLTVTLGGELNSQTKKIMFDMVELPLPYNGILGRPTLAKFLAASHYAYNKLKMLGLMSIITVSCNKRDALTCVDQLYQEAVAVSAAKILAPATEKKTGKALATDKAPGSGKGSCTHSGKRASLECCVPAEDVPKSSTSKSNKSKVAPPET